jgi:hypothetical protein
MSAELTPYLTGAATEVERSLRCGMPVLCGLTALYCKFASIRVEESDVADHAHSLNLLQDIDVRWGVVCVAFMAQCRIYMGNHLAPDVLVELSFGRAQVDGTLRVASGGEIEYGLWTPEEQAAAESLQAPDSLIYVPRLPQV